MNTRTHELTTFMCDDDVMTLCDVTSNEQRCDGMLSAGIHVFELTL